MAWRYSVGEKGVNRVTVFERKDGTSIYVEWWDDRGRHKASFRSLLGHPITDREQAKQAAHRMAAAQERKRNQAAAEALGLPSPRTLPDLLKALHMGRSSDWSDRYKREQERYRDFWLEKLGNVRLTAVPAALVERIAAKGYPDAPSARRHALRYIVDAYYYAERKLKWIEPRHNLSAVTMPKRARRKLAYTMGEAITLLPALEEIDLRAGWLGHVLFQTGRRLTATRTLPEADRWVSFHDGYAVLHYPSDTDKAGAEGEAVVTGRALELTRRVAEEGWETPTMEQAQDWMDEAEALAGVKNVKGRSWHGLKRLWATLAKGHPGREHQGGTTRETLDRVYVQDHLEPKVELAKMLAGRLAGR